MNLWEGNNPTSNGESEEIPPGALHMQEADRDAYLGAQAKQYILAQPGRFALRTVKKCFLLYDRETIGVHWNLDALEAHYGQRSVAFLKLLSDGFWYTVLLTGIAGLVLLFRQRGSVGWLSHVAVALWFYFTAVNAVIVVQDRYHMCSIPFIAALAAMAVGRARRKQRRPPERSTAGRVAQVSAPWVA